MLNLGLLVIRLIFGLSFARHGTEKLFGWFGGHGIKGNAGFFESIGIKPGVPMAFLAGLGELLGGLLFAAGVFIPIAAILMVGTMIVAIATVTGKNGFSATASGYEYNLAIIAAVVGIFLTGPGAYVLF
ncbi:DoxX family protein [Desulfitobacterium sp.]|uniref:DoxX family protein n=1 Tax=Desulfitobacterium sp. TaxID=49981 RepID=UPI002C40F148|nr:DoxX family protein [Desulfitobacterium sp.]HVJ49851.1 DoxX family protein [Desulfitobacterium sp.]